MIFHFYLFSELHIIVKNVEKIKLIDLIEQIRFNRKNQDLFPTLVKTHMDGQKYGSTGKKNKGAKTKQKSLPKP